MVVAGGSSGSRDHQVKGRRLGAVRALDSAPMLHSYGKKPIAEHAGLRRSEGT
jgi:hypothetical protein